MIARRPPRKSHSPPLAQGLGEPGLGLVVTELFGDSEDGAERGVGWTQEALLEGDVGDQQGLLGIAGSNPGGHRFAHVLVLAEPLGVRDELVEEAVPPADDALDDG